MKSQMGNDKDKKEIILLAAKKKFAQKGFHGARMSEIAKEAKVNKALIHYYFENKESLYKEVVMRAYGLGKRNAIAIYTDNWDLEPPQKLYILFYFLIHLTLKADRDRYRILFWEIVEGINYHEQGIQEFVIPIHNILMSIIKEGIEKGVFDTPDPQLLNVFMLFSIFHYNLDKEIFGNSSTFNELYGNKTDEEVFITVITIMFKSLSPEEKSLVIPEIPKDIKSFLDKLIDEASGIDSIGNAQELLNKIRDIILN